MTSSTTRRVVILGGGFGGFYAALALDRTVARLPGTEVLLVAPHNFLLFTPMLHEVASGSLDPASIVVPIRPSLRHVRFVQAEATGIDLDARTVTAVHGLGQRSRTLPFDQLLIAVGSQTRYPESLRPHAHGMKTIHDALLLRNGLISLLERAEIEEDAAVRRAMLTVVVAGGGFAGVETIGALNDLLREAARHYPRAAAALQPPVLVEPFDRLLPEFEPALGTYTESRLRAAGIDVRLRSKVAGFDGRVLALEAADDAGRTTYLDARTLIWTAGAAPSPLIESLPLLKDRGRIVVDSSLAVLGHEGIWACGDCAAAPDPTGKPYPTTAQHAIRQGGRVGANIAAALRGRPQDVRPFHYRMLGQFAAIGRRRAVATLLGVRFSGFLAWLLWRTVYLLKLPRLDRQARVALQWALDLGFARDTVQLLDEQLVRSGRVEELIEGTRAAEARTAARERG